MSDKMQVLYIEQTGHILAAFTRVADADSLTDIKTILGDGLLVHNLKSIPSAAGTAGETLFVPLDQLKVKVVKLNPGAFFAPLGFVVNGGEASELGNVKPSTPSLTVNDIKITITTAVSEATNVWVQIQENNPPPGDEPKRRVMSGQITPVSSTSTGKDVTLTLRLRPNSPPASIPKKEFDILALVAGEKPLFARLTPP